MATRPANEAALFGPGASSPRPTIEACQPERTGQSVSDWHAYDATDPVARQALAAELEQALPVRKMAHDVDWLGVVSATPGHRLVTLIDRDGEGIVGIAPFHVHECGLSFWIGEISVYSKAVERFAMDEGPLTRRQQTRAATDECLAALAGLLKRRNVVFIGGVPRDSELQSLIDDETSLLRQRFYVVPHGTEYLRCRVAWNGRFEDYLGSLSARERSKLRRALKRFADLPDTRSRVRRFQTPAEIDRFLADAIPVSARTYQSRLLDLGLESGGAAEREIRASAARGYFLGHVLYINEAPAAFHYGHVFKGCFFMAAAGYDPRYATHEIGIVLFLEVLKDIEKRGDPIDLMDNLYGGGSYKERTSNIKSPERHYYLIPKTASGAILANSLRWTDSLSRGLGNWLAKHGLKDRIKKLIRRGN